MRHMQGNKKQDLKFHLLYKQLTTKTLMIIKH